MVILLETVAKPVLRATLGRYFLFVEDSSNDVKTRSMKQETRETGRPLYAIYCIDRNTGTVHVAVSGIMFEHVYQQAQQYVGGERCTQS